MSAPRANNGGTKFGPYTIYERLGQGGMCLVFRARHERADYDCALKVLRSDQRDDERIMDLFITEADLSLLLQHPNLVRTYDSGEVDGRYFIAMELMQGGTLGELVTECERRQVRLPQDFALFVVSEILAGLHGLHEALGATGRPLGLIHRDITPHNIFLSFDGRVILGDFGVALIQAYGDTSPGEILGKLGYLAPEMVSMEEVDRRADVFAAGVVLYELLTGERMFEGTDEDLVLSNIADAKFTRPRKIQPNISRALEQVLLKVLARKPKDRHEDANAALQALKPLWSRHLGNPYAMAALLAAIYPERAANWRAEQRSQA